MKMGTMEVRLPCCGAQMVVEKTRAGTKKLVCMNCRRRWLVSMQVNDRYEVVGLSFTEEGRQEARQVLFD
jgi:hypothetical protein